MRRLRRRGLGGRLVLAVAVGGALFAIATAVQAAIPDASGMIHGCYNPNGAEAGNGAALNVIDSAAASCKGNNTAITWNQQGPKGATGGRGATGAKGTTGATGPAGSLSSFDHLAGLACTRESVQGTISITYAADGTVTLRCDLPAGYTALAAAANAGDMNIKVASVTGMVAGGTLTVDTTGVNPETVTITTVGTAGAGGTGVTFTPPLASAHALGVLVHVN